MGAYRVEIKTVKVEVPEGCNIILGTAHFIKTVEDIYEALVLIVIPVAAGLGLLIHLNRRK